MFQLLRIWPFFLPLPSARFLHSSPSTLPPSPHPWKSSEKYTHEEVFSRAGFIDEISSFDGYRLGRLEVECARYNYGIMSVSVWYRSWGKLGSVVSRAAPCRSATQHHETAFISPPIGFAENARFVIDHGKRLPVFLFRARFDFLVEADRCRDTGLFHEPTPLLSIRVQSRIDLLISFNCSNNFFHTRTRVPRMVRKYYDRVSSQFFLFNFPELSPLSNSQAIYFLRYLVSFILDRIFCKYVYRMVWEDRAE